MAKKPNPKQKNEANGLATFTTSVCKHSRRMPHNIQRAADPTAQPAVFFAYWCLTCCSIQLLGRIRAGVTCRSARTVTNTICEDFHICLLRKHMSNTGPCSSPQKAALWHRAKRSIHPQVGMQLCSWRNPQHRQLSSQPAFLISLYFLPADRLLQIPCSLV